MTVGSRRRRDPLRALRRLAGGALFCAGVASPPGLWAQALPASSLTIHGAPSPFWTSNAAPVRWTPAPSVVAALRWRAVGRGTALAELALDGVGEAARLRVIVLRVDPRAVRLSLAYARGATGGTWSIDSTPRGALAAFNAGQFDGGSPWGWVVRDGREALPPQHGPLAVALLQRRDGGVEWVPNGEVTARRARRDDVAWAFQSYPLLLDSGGVVPPMLRGGRALDLAHRDRRLAIGSDREGRLLVMLTEVDLPALRDVPLGLTIPETAALMGALGAERAVALDGGISAQLRVGARRWRGWRRVPLALVVQRR
ncbi:MAG: phosphodiester glycosidase family protein [Gemmatimonadaceae bacterium]